MCFASHFCCWVFVVGFLLLEWMLLQEKSKAATMETRTKEKKKKKKKPHKKAMLLE